MFQCLLATCIMDTVMVGACFSEQEEGVNITANSLHPGSIVTNLFRYNGFIRGNHLSISCNDEEILGLRVLRQTYFLVNKQHERGVSFCFREN